MRYHIRRIRFLWRLRNGLPWRLACIVGLTRSPSWDTVRPFYR